RKALTAFDVISANDVIELSNELGISEDKLTYAVLEVISKRKNGGKK
ncbi:putative phage protein, partial [Lactococcus cremoris subsp. cremoris GE214]